jgi:hypothetical protein
MSLPVALGEGFNFDGTAQNRQSHLRAGRIYPPHVPRLQVSTQTCWWRQMKMLSRGFSAQTDHSVIIENTATTPQE